MPLLYIYLLCSISLSILPVDLLKLELTSFNFLMFSLYIRKKGKKMTPCFTSITKIVSIVVSVVGLYPVKQDNMCHTEWGFEPEDL